MARKSLKSTLNRVNSTQTARAQPRTTAAVQIPAAGHLDRGVPESDPSPCWFRDTLLVGRQTSLNRRLGTRSFASYVFTTFKNAQDYAGVRAEQTTYVLVRVASGAEKSQVRQDILNRVKDVDVFTSAEFSHMTRFYWMFTTGAGVAVQPSA
jgi:hypothetical protein